MRETVIVRHSSRCVALFKLSKRKQEGWRKLWPEACGECRGTGLRRDGSGECPGCLAYGFCPRCDAEGTVVNEALLKCLNCGWVPSDPGACEPPLSPCLGPTSCPEVPHE